MTFAARIVTVNVTMQNANTSGEAVAALSPRQQIVALRLAQGASCREIADEFNLSIKTVDTHRGAVLRRTGCRNAADLARMAIRLGWIDVDGTVLQ